MPLTGVARKNRKKNIFSFFFLRQPFFIILACLPSTKVRLRTRVCVCCAEAKDVPTLSRIWFSSRKRLSSKGISFSCKNPFSCLDLEIKRLRQHIGRTGKSLQQSPMCIAFSKIALHRIGEKETQSPMGRYDGFTLKKKIRDSSTDEAPRPHSSTCLFLALVVQCKRLVPSLRHRGILARHVQLYTRYQGPTLIWSERHQIDCIDCQSNWQNSFLGKEKKQKHFLFL